MSKAFVSNATLRRLIIRTHGPQLARYELPLRSTANRAGTGWVPVSERYKISHPK